MATSDLKQKIENALSHQPSQWMEKALCDEVNEAWLERSSNIALRILGAIQLNVMSQKELAEQIGVSPQQVNKIVKGRENLTLETISKLEAAFGIVLLTLPPSSEINTHNSSNLSAEQKQSTVKKSGAKTAKVLQLRTVAGKVHEAGSGYGKEVN